VWEAFAQARETGREKGTRGVDSWHWDYRAHLQDNIRDGRIMPCKLLQRQRNARHYLIRFFSNFGFFSLFHGLSYSF
jgi:hypothetical protein